MNDAICQALATDRVIDITTIGRKSGDAKRIETWFHNIDGEIILTGTPGRRDWYANMVANPRFTFHLKESATADIEARAFPITATEERREVLQQILARLDRSDAIEQWVADSPLVRVDLDVDCPQIVRVTRGIEA